MSYTLGELAQQVGGELCGDANRVVSGADIIRDVQNDQITIAEHARHSAALADCPAVAAVVPTEFQPDGIDLIVVNDVHAAFADIVRLFRPVVPGQRVGISGSAHVSSTASLGPDVVVHPTATIGDDVVIGANSVIHPGVHLFPGCRLGNDVTVYAGTVLYENTVVGDRVLIHANAVIGCYGFGYATRDGLHQLSAQLGAVKIGDDVEIGAGTTIDRGTYGDTSIGDGTKIDNQVQIAHNCKIGRHNLLCAQVGVAGSCTTGDYVVMAGQVGLRDHLDIGNEVVVGAKSGVMHNVPDGQVFMGIPATPARQQKVQQVAISKLPEMRREFKELSRRVQELEQLLQRDAA